MEHPPQWTIERKRDGTTLSAEEIRSFILAYHRGEIPDYQMSALCMTILWRGMNPEEVSALTSAMMESGQCLDSSSLSQPVIDKHSSGGIGDKTSLILAPMAAACGLAVPMISGRGLGLTGGTLDKLESLPGYRTRLSEQELLAQLAKEGCAIVGQSEQLAPADRKLYALRDVTGCVPSIPLITASIMCKKLSEGLHGLVLDVKVGRGAFMKHMEDARELADSMIRVGRELNTPVCAVISNMDHPLGHSVGNAVEVQECIDLMQQGPSETPLWILTRDLGARMLQLAGRCQSLQEGQCICNQALQSGAVWAKAEAMFRAQGWNGEALPQAPLQVDIPSPQAGWVQDLDAEKIGRLVLLLGGGRRQVEDQIDHAVGLSRLCQVAEPLETGQTLATLHLRREDQRSEATALLLDAIHIGEQAPDPSTLIYETRGIET